MIPNSDIVPDFEAMLFAWFPILIMNSMAALAGSVAVGPLPINLE